MLKRKKVVWTWLAWKAKCRTSLQIWNPCWNNPGPVDLRSRRRKGDGEEGKKGGGLGREGKGPSPSPSPFPFPRFRAFLPLPVPLPFLRLPRRLGPGRRQLRFPSFPVKRFFGRDKTHFGGSNSFKRSVSLKMTLKLKGQSWSSAKTLTHTIQ